MHYGAIAKTLHWGVACLLVLQFPLAWTMPRVPQGQMPESLVRLHLSIGLTILGAMLLRLVWRWRQGAPRLPNTVPDWRRHAAAVVHALLYATLLATPLAGWAWASSRGWPIVLYGIIALPRLVKAGSTLAPLAAAAHRYFAWAILVLIAVHVLAALDHAIVRRDGVVARMLPR
jgi:cytochrome b561